MHPIYLDNHATTPVDPRVLDAMLPYFGSRFGNAASRSHLQGREAEQAVAEARAVVANELNAQASALLFTSGATESNNLALKGVVQAPWYARSGDHVVSCATEHKSVLDTLKALETKGLRYTILPVDTDGRVSPAHVAAALEPRTLLVSIMHANNEIGTVHPIGAIGRAIKAARPDVLFHVDAAQSFGKLPIDVGAMAIDLLSLSAHKLYGPKGVGALYVRPRSPRVRLACQIHGGGHERGMRSGTLNVPGIVGLAAATRFAHSDPEESTRITALRDRLQDGLCSQLQGVRVNGGADARLAGNLNMCFACVDGAELLLEVPEIALSTGSACTSGSLEPSYVIQALGVAPELAHTAVRFGVGRFTSASDIERCISALVAAVQRIRERSPAWTSRQA